MSLLDRLLALGEGLGIVCSQPSGESEVAKVSTRTVTMKDLCAEVQRSQGRQGSQGSEGSQGGTGFEPVLPPQELTVEFDKVFQASGLKPLASPWTIEHVAKVLEGPPYTGRERPDVQRMLLEAIKAAGFCVEDVIKDALARDKAIDQFATRCRAKLDEQAAAGERTKAQLQDQIKQLQRQCEELDADARTAAEQWKQWWARKLAFEERMAWATGFLLDRPVVTVEKSEPTGKV